MTDATPVAAVPVAAPPDPPVATVASTTAAAPVAPMVTFPAPAPAPAPAPGPAPAFTLAPTPVDPTTAAMEIAGGLAASLRRRSFLTGEFWAPIAGAAGSATLAQIGVPGPEAVQVIGVLAPILAGGFVAALRHVHKQNLAELVQYIARFAHS